ncbi:unnamed protein product [Durusdinium trenchii]|uniref:HTTM domain-containing protein n=1 Tax=Durusdinium trenchii TaxID=1381693 RepID=A0ABP0KHM4_9DINO
MLVLPLSNGHDGGLGSSLFVRLWCLAQLVAVSWHWPRQRDFYAWFHQSQLSEARRRGLATYGYPVFGFIEVPRWSLNELEVITQLYRVVLLSGFLAPLWMVPCVPVLGLILSIFYHGSLWAERASSHHRGILSVTLWMYLTLAPDLPQALAAFRAHISTIYAMSVLQKSFCSAYRGRSWARWSLHGFLWKSMWAKPYFPSLQRFLFLRPAVAHLLGWTSVLLELGPLLVLLAPQVAWLQCCVYGGLMAMHLAVLLLQGIDYVSYWTPNLMVGLLCSDAPLSVLSNAWTTAATGPWGVWVLVPMLTLLGAQLLFALGMAENFNINLPPLMSCPMFVTIARLDDRCHQHYVMTVDGSIPYERIEWMYPFVRAEYGMALTQSDVAHFPMPFVAFGWGGSLEGAPGLFHHFFREIRGFYLITNVRHLPKSLQSQLRSIVLDLHAGGRAGNQSHRPSPYENLASLADRCAMARRAFRQHVARTARCHDGGRGATAMWAEEALRGERFERTTTAATRRVKREGAGHLGRCRDGTCITSREGRRGVRRKAWARPHQLPAKKPWHASCIANLKRSHRAR